MDRYPEFHKGSARQTIMDQETIFKQQVHELHRLYDVQKTLMGEVKLKETNKLWNSAFASETSDSSYSSINYTSGDQFNSDIFLQLQSAKAAPSLRELSIWCGDPSRKQKRYYLEQSSVDDDSAIATQNETPVLLEHPRGKTSVDGQELYSIEENEIDLTLSIGCVTNKKKS